MNNKSLLPKNQIFRMSPEVKDKGRSYHIKVMMLGYGIPLLIMLLMIITEFSVNTCSNFHPGFGQKG